MLSLSINQNQFSDLLNLNYGVFLPLKNFVNEKNFKNILIKKKIDNKFFPIPIFFGIKKIDYNKIKNSTKIKIIYKRKLIAIVRLKSLFKIDHKIYGKKIFGKNFKNHSYYSKFKKENYAFIDLEYIKLEKKNLKDKNFVPPIKFKKRINFKNKKKKSLAGFHTRNVPHSAHQWIHQFLIKKYSNILIQPLIGQYKKNEYLDQIIKKTNLIAIKMYPRKKAFYLPYFSYPRYGGPLEASLHAIVRKNYGCTHFWVGRDHAGYKNFYSKYASQNFCKKNQKRLGINIIAENEPYFCSSCKLIVNKQCKVKKCVNAKKVRISGTKIRNLVKRNKPVPEILMKKEISIILDKKSII